MTGLLGVASLLITPDLLGDLIVSPSQFRRHEHGCVVGHPGRPIPGLDGQAGAAGQYIVEMEGPFCCGCVGDLGSQVPMSCGQGS